MSKQDKINQALNFLHVTLPFSSFLVIEGSQDNDSFFVRSASNMDKRGQRLILINSLSENSKIDIEKLQTFVNENMITHKPTSNKNSD